MDIKIYKPSVELLSSYDERVTAWNISRPLIEPVTDSSFIESIDLAVNELKMYTFKITSSVLFRELVTSIRPVHPWSSTSRNTLPDEFGIMQEYLDKPYFEHLKNSIAKFHSQLGSSHQDIARMELPIAHNTTYTIMINHRTLFSFLKTIKHYSLQLYSIYGQLFIKELGLQDSPIDVLDACKYGSLYTSVALNFDETEYALGSSEKVAGMRIMKSEMKIALVAQLVRHSANKVKTSLWNDIENFDYLSQRRLNDTITVVIYMPDSSYTGMVSHRSCNIADPVLWNEFLSTATGNMNADEFANILPCKCSSELCPFSQDMDARVKGEDPGPICPIYVNDSSHINRMKDIYGDNNTTVKNFIKLVDANLIKSK